MTEVLDISLQFLKFFAANFFGITIFVLIYFFSGPAFAPVKNFLKKASTNTRLPYFIWGTVPLIVSAFLAHCLYGTMVFKTAGNLNPIEIFKGIIVFGFNVVAIYLLTNLLIKNCDPYKKLISKLNDTCNKILNLILVSPLYVLLTIVFYVVNKLWIFKC